MTDLVTKPQQRVQDIQRLLRESYGSGFTIFKELVQNAEDAGARRMILAAHCGFAEAENPLLRAPGLFIANDGPVLKDHWEALTYASGGGKADDQDSVGRFGLGQKALYHLCDAFAVLGRIADEGDAVRSMVLNPFENIRQAATAGSEWKDPLVPSDEVLLRQWVEERGLRAGLAIYVPLRTATLRPGPGSVEGTTLSLRDRNWTPDEAVDDILDGEQLAATLCCLRRLEQIDITPLSGPARQFQIAADAVRLCGPRPMDNMPEDGEIHGSVTLGKGQVRFYGRQTRRFDGAAAALLREDGWPEVFNIEGRSVPPKATPHGAALVCRYPLAPGEKPRLRAWQAVYLPLGDPDQNRDQLLLIDREIEQGSEHVDIVVHGDFFVTSDRSGLRRDGGIESRWNKALLQEGSLPSVLDAVHMALTAMAPEKGDMAFVRALRANDWWSEHGAAVCGSRALARCREGGGFRWTIVQATSLRPLPAGETTRPARMKAAWPQFEAWCAEQGFVLAYGTMLAATTASWRDAELAAIIRGVGAAAFSDGKVAETLADILALSTPGAEARAALAESLREASRRQTSAAPLAIIKRLTVWLDSRTLFVLPKTVSDKGLVAALADVPDLLSIKEEWLEQAPIGATLAGRQAAALLKVLAPLAGKDSKGGKQADQAITAIAQVIRQVPDFGTLAQDSELAHLPFFPVVRVADGALLLINPVQTQKLLVQKLLFQHTPGNALKTLAAAVARPEIYQVRQNLGDLGLPLASGSSVSDRCQVVAQVAEFGPAAARKELIDDLATHLDRRLLRRLVVGETGLPDTATLAELKGLDPALGPLVVTRLGSSGEMRLIDSEVAGALKGTQRSIIGLDEIDVRWLTDRLRGRASGLPVLDAGQAVALLKSGVPDDVLGAIALHRAVGLSGLHAATTLVQGKLPQLPPALRERVHAVELWEDPDAARVQRRLIGNWTSERMIEAALACPEPQVLMMQISDALVVADDPLPPALVNHLRRAAWLLIGGAAVSPADLRNLPVDALAALRGGPTAVAIHAPVHAPGDLPPGVAEQLARHRLIPSEEQSFAAALQDLQAARVPGLAFDAMQHWRDLRSQAQGRAPLGTGVWPLLASMLRAIKDDGAATRLWRSVQLAAPGLEETVGQANDLAGTASGTGSLAEAAGRLHRVIFDGNRLALSDGKGFFPAHLLLRSEGGQYVRAGELALDARGVLPDAHVWREYGLRMPGEGVEIADPDAGPRLSLAEVMKQLLEPFRPLSDLHPQVVMVLAMIGSSAGIKELAESFNPQRSFEDVRADLDNCARQVNAPCGTITGRLAQIELLPRLEQDGAVYVTSVAGSACRAPMDGHDEVILVSCGQYREDRLPNGQGIKIYPLILAPVRIRDEDHGARVLAGFVRTLAPVLMMGADRERQALAELLDSYRRIDQASLDDVLAEIRDTLHERLDALKAGEVLHHALVEFRGNVKRLGREEAKRLLWASAAMPEASAAMLGAVRQKIALKGYDPSRALFELFQNAVDAARQAHKRTDLRVEAQRDGEGAITNLRLVHWGRPINVNGPDPDEAYREDHGRDLANMLVMDHSAKDGVLHGRHGLGFKTVHMLSDNARVACGSLSFEITGGMLPQPWPDGRALLGRYNRGHDRATVIDLPVPPSCAEAARQAWDSFIAAAPLLPAMAPDEIASIILCDGHHETELAAEVNHVAEGVAWLSYDARQEKSALRFAMGDGFDLYLQCVGESPVAFSPKWDRLWNLVPLDGEASESAWIIEGPFGIDQGRRHLAGNFEGQTEQFHKLGTGLGRSLANLYGDWEAMACIAGLSVGARDAFFSRLIELLARDLRHEGPHRHLHGPGRGLGALLEQCPLVPLAFGGMARADQVEWALAGALANPVVLEGVRTWINELDLAGDVVEEAWARRLTDLGLSPPRDLSLAAIARRLFETRDVPPSRARLLGSVFSPTKQQGWPTEELRAVSEALKKLRLQAEDGSYQPANYLAFPQDPRLGNDGEVERARADVAPLSGRLHPSYIGEGIDFAHFARNADGYRMQSFHEWLKTADADPARAVAALRYLVDRPGEIKALALFMPWLPRGEDLAKLAALRALTPQQQAILQVSLGAWSPPSTLGGETVQEHYEVAEVFRQIAEWWQDQREKLIADYDEDVYPERHLFDPARLTEGLDEDWFTMLSLAMFQNMGRTQPDQSRSFVQGALHDGWWQELALVGPDDRELRPYVERLLEWSEPDGADKHMVWRRYLVDLCRIARNLGDYRELFRAFPRHVAAAGGKASLSVFLQPQFSQVAARMDIEAPGLSRSLGMGANWMIRELSRCGFYTRDHAALAAPFGWSAVGRVRALLERIGLGRIEPGIDAGRHMHGMIARCLPGDQPLGPDGDLPLHVITLARHRHTLDAILGDCFSETWPNELTDA